MLATVESIRRYDEGMVHLDVWPTNEARRLTGGSVITLLVDTVSEIDTSWVEEGRQIWMRARMLTMDNHTLACQAMQVMPARSASEPSI